MDRIGRMVSLLVVLSIAAACMCLFSGCSKDEPKENTSRTDGGKPAASVPGGSAPAPAAPAAESLTPARWADAMAACYQTAIKDTLAALEGTPPADQALPKVKALFEKSIQRHVPLGKQREAMTPPDRAKADTSFAMKLMSLQSSDDFRAYTKLSNGPYSTNKAKTDAEKECARLIRGINIISQYGDFDVLRKQEPKEADRLGIK